MRFFSNASFLRGGKKGKAIGTHLGGETGKEEKVMPTLALRLKLLPQPLLHRWKISGQLEAKDDSTCDSKSPDESVFLFGVRDVVH